jgi:5-methylcytosine-specific restriction endonuclease McrA
MIAEVLYTAVIIESERGWGQRVDEVREFKTEKAHHSVFHTRDHVIPDSVGLGDCPDSRANRVVCCRRCNGLKEDLTLHEFKRHTFFGTLARPPSI